MKFQRVASVVMAMTETLLYSGILYGWGSLNSVLITEGFFSDGCSENETEIFENTSDYKEVTRQLCDRQMCMLDLVFTIASTVALVLNLFTGFIYDKIGGWITRTYCLVILSTGLFMSALSDPGSSSLLVLSFSMMAHSGTGLYTVNVQVANFFPKYRSFICALISGMYDSSSLIFVVFSKIYKQGITFKTIFLSHAVLSIFLHASTFILTPRYPPTVPLPEEYVFGYRELTVACRGENEKNDWCKGQKTGSTPEKMISFKQCLKLPYTWTNVLHTCILQFSMANFIGNFHLWINSTFKEEDPRSIEQYTTMFGLMQCCGVVFSPLSGLLMDYLRSHFKRSLPLKLASLKAAAYSILIATVLAILMLIFSLIPVFKLQIVTFIMQGMARAFICGTLCSYLNIAYPTYHFGKIFGMNMLILGVVYLLQYPLTILIIEKLDCSFTLVNFSLLGLSLIATCHPFYIFYFVRNHNQSRSMDDKIPMVHVQA